MEKPQYNHNAESVKYACLGDLADKYPAFVDKLCYIFVKYTKETMHISEVIEAIENFISQDPRLIRMVSMLLFQVMPSILGSLSEEDQKHIIREGLNLTDEELEEVMRKFSNSLGLSEKVVDKLEQLRDRIIADEPTDLNDIISDVRKMIDKIAPEEGKE